MFFLYTHIGSKNQIPKKNREKSLVIKSEGFISLLEVENAGKGERDSKKRESFLESRIEISAPMLMTLDTPHGPNKKLLKKCLKNALKMREIWFLVKKLHLKSAYIMHSKLKEKFLNQRQKKAPPLHGNADISLLPPFLIYELFMSDSKIK